MYSFFYVVDVVPVKNMIGAQESAVLTSLNC